MIILTHSVLSLWLSCINLHRLGWHKSQGDPVCRCMTHSQDENYCKPPLAHRSCWWTNFIQLSSESYVLPTYFYFCKWGLISRGDLFQMYLGCLLLYSWLQSGILHTDSGHDFVLLPTCPPRPFSVISEICYLCCFYKEEQKCFLAAAEICLITALYEQTQQTGNIK